MVKRLSKHHYLATPGEHNNSNSHGSSLGHRSLINPDYHQQHYRISNHRGYSTDGEDSRAPSDRTMSEYMIANERAVPGSATLTTSLHKHHRSRRSRSTERPPRAHSVASHHSAGGGGGRHYDENSDIYVTTGAYRPPSEISRVSRYSHHSRPASAYSYRSGHPMAPSEVSTVKTKVTRRPGMTIETMSAPNPFCPNTKGICCLMLLLNLGLILVTLGFVIVIQFFEPLFVWVLGIIFLIFGFLTLMSSVIYCVYICRDVKTPKQVAMQDHYWTHHWQKSFGTTPEIHYKSEKYPPPEHDRISDRYSDHHRNRY